MPLGKNKIYYSQVLEGTQHSWGHTVRSQVERERQCGPDFIEVEDGVPRFCGFIIYWWIKNIRAGIKPWGGKSRVTTEVAYLGHPGLSIKGTSWVGSPGSVSSCVAGNVFIQDEWLWNGCLGDPKLNVRHLHCTLSDFWYLKFF